MSNQTIIQLRQKDSDNVRNNGDYTVNTKNIQIGYGDAITLHSTYIDTRTIDSNNINIEEDTTITFQYGFYLVNTLPTLNKYLANWRSDDNSNLPLNQTCDGKQYVLVHNDGSKPIGNYSQINNVVLNVKNNGRDIPQYNLTYSYTDLQGETKNGSSTTPYLNKDHLPDTATVNINIITETGTFQLTNLNQPPLSDNYTLNTINSIPITSGHYEVYQKQSTILIPAGTYTTTDMAKLINDKMTIIREDQALTEHDLVNNPLLFNSRDINGATPPTQPTQKYYFLDTKELKNVFFIDSDKYIGTSQFDLQFNDETQKFEFDYLHTPIYDAGKNIVGVYGEDAFQQVNNPVYHLSGAYSGIFFTNITSSPQQDIFETKLGFDFNNELIVNLSNVPFKTVDIGDSTSQEVGGSSSMGYDLTMNIQQFELKIGQHITSGYTGIDTGINKGSNFYEVPAPASYNPTIETTSIISATNSTTLTGNDNGYFLLDLNIPLLNDLITSDTIRKNIYSIVSKYYSYDSYTSQTGEEIVYIHNSPQPLTISSFDVRILNPDYSLAYNNLGNDNTVFLLLRKAQQQLQQK